jgi:hypothetical protein
MQQYAKAIVAIVGATAVAVAQQFPEHAATVSIVCAFITAVGVYLVPNLPQD